MRDPSKIRIQTPPQPLYIGTTEITADLARRILDVLIESMTPTQSLRLKDAIELVDDDRGVIEEMHEPDYVPRHANAPKYERTW